MNPSFPLKKSSNGILIDARFNFSDLIIGMRFKMKIEQKRKTIQLYAQFNIVVILKGHQFLWYQFL